VFVLTPPISDRDRSVGSLSAKIALVQYGDYQCLESGKAHQIVKTLQQNLGNQLCFVFRHFPRADIHPHAQHAAEAAEAATAQGKFWQMHDCLFANQASLSDGYLVEYAAMLDLDVERFLQDIAEDVRVERVRQDVESGIASGVITTPTFFINGTRYDGECGLTSLLTAIQAQIALSS
jgi:protein-disulfide isomerase